MKNLMRKGREKGEIPAYLCVPPHYHRAPGQAASNEAGQNPHDCLSPAQWTRNGVTMHGTTASHRSVPVASSTWRWCLSRCFGNFLKERSG